MEAFWKRRSVDAQGLRTTSGPSTPGASEQAVEQFRDLHNDRARDVRDDGPDPSSIDCQDV